MFEITILISLTNCNQTAINILFIIAKTDDDDDDDDVFTTTTTTTTTTQAPTTPAATTPVETTTIPATAAPVTTVLPQIPTFIREKLHYDCFALAFCIYSWSDKTSDSLSLRLCPCNSRLS